MIKYYDYIDIIIKKINNNKDKIHFKYRKIY